MAKKPAKIDRIALPLDDHQVAVVALVGGQASCWTSDDSAARDNEKSPRVAGFNDPEVWSGLEVWPEYFMRQDPDMGWGLEGAGLVMVDLDKKRLWALPGKRPLSPTDLHLPVPPLGDGFDVDTVLVDKAMNQLLSDPGQWGYCSLLLSEVGALASIRNPASRTPGHRHATLADLLPASLTPAQARIRIQADRGNTLAWGPRRYHVDKSHFAPRGWKVVEAPGASPHLELLSFMREVRESGFPRPDAASMDVALMRATEGLSTTTRRRIHTQFDEIMGDWPSGQFSPPPSRFRRRRKIG